jgi:hypothetical protein
VVLVNEPIYELASEAVKLVEKHGSISAAARSLGLSRTTMQHRYHAAARLGLLGTKPVMPGFEIAKVSSKLDENGNVVQEHVQQRLARGGEFELPPGHIVKGVSALVDADGRTVQTWFKTREGEVDPLAIAEALKVAFKDYKPAARVAPLKIAVSKDLMTVVPVNDWHVGMFAWGKEVGTNWDLKIAEDTIGPAVEDTIARSPASEECILLGGGDLLHSDNSENQTSRSGNNLDVDGRYPKVVEVATRLMVRTVDAALRRHRKIVVRVLPGNHDEHSAVAVAYFLKAWYRADPRVEVDTDPSLFFWHRFGSVLIGATHGHTVKIKDMPSIMAHRRAEDWGATKYRYVHGFHLHHSAKVATEGNGVIAEVHQAPIPQDAWHWGSGYLSGRSMQAITYHREYGEIGRVRTAILDAEAA